MTDLNEVFKLVEVTAEQVTIEVTGKDLLTIAKHPYISGDMAYITITRGKNHVFTIIYNNGMTWDFNFGKSGYTLISEGTERLKRKVLQFIEDNSIILDYMGQELSTATIYYNSNLNKWQLALGCCNTWSNEAFSFEEAREAFKCYVEAESWKEDKAPTGFTVYRAINPSFHIK